MCVCDCLALRYAVNYGKSIQTKTSFHEHHTISCSDFLNYISLFDYLILIDQIKVIGIPRFTYLDLSFSFFLPQPVGKFFCSALLRSVTTFLTKVISHTLSLSVLSLGLLSFRSAS
jgi:hypothetical protein